ncbi:hypothetical protein ACGC1H_002912 [Rhizoctonia solani]
MGTRHAHTYLEWVATSAITRSRVDDTEALTVDSVGTGHGYQGTVSADGGDSSEEEESGGELCEHGEWMSGYMGRCQSVEWNVNLSLELRLPEYWGMGWPSRRCFIARPARHLARSTFFGHVNLPSYASKVLRVYILSQRRIDGSPWRYDRVQWRISQPRCVIRGSFACYYEVDIESEKFSLVVRPAVCNKVSLRR